MATLPPVTPAIDDDIDHLLVRLLAADGRTTLAALGTRAGLSTSAVQARVRRLEATGAIKGYAAAVNYEALGLPLAAFIAITPLDPAQPDDAPQQLADLPAIEACYSVAGAESYVLKVRVATPGALEHLLGRIRAAAGVATRTSVVLSTPYEARPPAV
jgi:Lrp/AsnC family transcriptional regulator, leucine-responsive regulatory protein